MPQITRHMVVFDRLGATPPRAGTPIHSLWVLHRGHMAWCLTELIGR